MDENQRTSKLSQPTAAEKLIRRIQFLNCQIVGFEQNLEVATHQLTFAQEILAETRDELKVAQQALEQAAWKTQAHGHL